MAKGKLYVMGMDQMVLPLTKHFIKEASVPTLAKFFARSAYGQALASFPCWTPNNWAAISTGAQSGTHGASSWFIRMPDGEDVSSLTSLGINAETIWEAAERQGVKSAILHYPGSMPSRLKQGYVIDGNAGPAYNACPFELAAAEAYTSDRTVESGSLKEIVLRPAQGWKGLPADGPAPFDYDVIPPGCFVYDLNCGPPTSLLKAAEERGLRAADGLSMFTYKAARAFELWTGVEAPLDVMRRAAALELEKRDA